MDSSHVEDVFRKASHWVQPKLALLLQSEPDSSSVIFKSGMT